MDQPRPHTRTSLTDDLHELGLVGGDIVIVHSSMKSLGYVVGGVQTVVQSLIDAIGPDGTLVVPTHVSDNSDPAAWQNPPVPESWWETIRKESPGFDRARTRSQWMGVIAEHVRTWPGAQRSPHPQVSVAAYGRLAESVTNTHPLNAPHGEGSPLRRIYDADGKVLLLGCDYESNTSLHLAETLQDSPRLIPAGASILQPDGSSRWESWLEVDTDESDFNELGAEFEATGAVRTGKIGEATARLMSQPELVDFAQAWMATHRKR